MLIYDLFRKTFMSHEKKSNNSKNLYGTGLYELSQNPKWYDKWCKRHMDFGGNMPLMSPLGSAIIWNNSDVEKLSEATYAERKGKSKPFSLSEETMRKISQI